MTMNRKNRRNARGASRPADEKSAGRSRKTAAVAKKAKTAKPAGGQLIQPPATKTMIPVVGLGGSAGALDPFKAFFAKMPSESGAAFVVIQHLAPAHVSLLPELLAQRTRMQVVQAQNAMPVAPNCVYVIPPNQDLEIRDGVLYLAESLLHGGIRMPIDHFFSSLAKDRQERAVCILFSGAGSDGTLGVRAIRGAGGLTVAQDPQTAQFGDLPRSAIATGLVDCILPPDRMPAAVTDYLRQPYVRRSAGAAALEAERKLGGFQKILAIVRNQTGCDFRCYKKATILRRIERRMGLRRITALTRYAALLGRDANEVRHLFNDLLINVTAFFRDADAFKELRRKFIAPLIKAKPMDEPVRVWSAGCSTGEEAYSLAMLLLDDINAAHKTCPVQMFATDIDEAALQFARAGVYSENAVVDVGPERLGRYFVRTDKGYQVGEALRNSVVFAAHNLIADPPFSKMDLISCRNLLIYLDAEAQAKLIPLFNFSLRAGGMLFLGKSESVGSPNDLFSLVSKKARLYRRVAPVRPLVLDSPILPGKRKMPLPVAGVLAKPQAATYADAIRQALLGHFAASVVLVEPRGQILQFHGQTGKYLDLPAAEPNLNLLDIAKEGLALRLRSALHTARSEHRTVVLAGVPITRKAGCPCARVTVVPLARHGDPEPLLAVIFENVSRPPLPAGEPVQSGGGGAAVKRLENELRVTQQDLQSSIEELQGSNEELRVANEEVVSSNEELQSTNEELETSKEELQSVNEELTTVNSQLQDKVERLDAAHSDMANLLKSTQIATLFLDNKLHIKFFTPAMTRLVKLIPTDVGRPVGDLSFHLEHYNLVADARAVAGCGAPIERDVRHADGSIYVVRVLPYRAQNDRVDGVVLTFDDITRLRREEERTRRLATVVQDSNDAVLVLDLKGKILGWNRGAQGLYGWSEAEALQLSILEMAPADKKKELSGVIRRLLAGEDVASYETQRRTKDGRILDVWLTVTALRDDAKQVVAAATTERDITERKQAEAKLQKSHALLEQRVAERTAALRESTRLLMDVIDGSTSPIFLKDRDGKFITINATLEKMLGRSREEIKGKTDYDIAPKDAADSWRASDQQVVATGKAIQIEEQADLQDGHHVFLANKFPLMDADGRMYGIGAISHDITDRKRAEEALRKTNEELSRFNRVAVGRELRMIELKKLVNELCAELGRPPRCNLDFEKE